MEKKEKIEMAAKLLRERHTFVDNAGDCPGLSYDFVIGDDGEEIDVFRADVNRDVFHWPETVVKIVDTLGLSCYVHMKEITFGSDKYGNEISKKVICMHVC